MKKALLSMVFISGLLLGCSTEHSAEVRTVELKREPLTIPPFPAAKIYLDLGQEFIQGPNEYTSGMGSRIKHGYKKDWNYLFVDRYGVEHAVSICLLAKGWVTTNPTWILTVDGQTVEKAMKGWGGWCGDTALQIDPIRFTVNSGGRTCNWPECRIKLFLSRTDYGVK